MSEGVDVMRRVYEAWNGGDVEAVVALMHPEVAVTLSGEFPGMPDDLSGRDGVRRFFELFADAWASIEVAPERYEDVGDAVLALFRFVGHSHAGVTVEREGAHLVRLRDGLVAELRAYGAWEDAERAGTLLRVYAAWNRSDLEGGLELVQPDIEFESSGDFPGLAPTYRGREEMRCFWDDLAGIWERLEVRNDALLELPDGRLLALNRFVGHARDGMKVERETAQIVRVEDGLVASMVTYGSWAGARAAAGLPG